MNYDLTVRNAGGSIVQFLYGEDGMSSVKLEDQAVHYIDYDKMKFQKTYLLTLEDLSTIEGIIDIELLKKLKKDKKWEVDCVNFYKKVLDDRNYFIEKIFKLKYETKTTYPVSLYRIIKNTKDLFHDMPTVSNLHPVDIINTLDKLESDLSLHPFNNGTKIFGMLLRCYLSPKQCILEHRLNKDSFEYIIQQINLKFNQAIANPSEMVGVIAAQSIGEP